jgi:hypothetical protein
VWQPIVAAGGLSSPPGGKRPPAGKIACHTKRTYHRCWDRLKFRDFRNSESRPGRQKVPALRKQAHLKFHEFRRERAALAARAWTS